MGTHECPYWEHHKLLLSLVGLWPYQSDFSRKCFAIFYGITSSSLVIQVVAEFHDSRTDLTSFVMTIVRMFMIFGCLGQFIMLCSRRHMIRRLYDKISQDWEVITNDEEKKILYEYSCKGRTITLIFSLSTSASYFVYLAFTYVPLFLEENESEAYPFYCNKWVVDFRYRNLQVILHDGVGVYYSTILFHATFSVAICGVEHVCGMYTILCYRLEKLMDRRRLIDSKEKRTEICILSGLIDIVKFHKEIMRRINQLVSLFGTAFFVIELGLLGSIAILLYNLGVNRTDVFTGIRTILIAYSLIIHTFFKNLVGENIIQNSRNILRATHEVPWYSMPAKVKKIFLMILIRANKYDSLTVGLMTWSFKNFTWIMKVSWSIATVMLTAQKRI